MHELSRGELGGIDLLQRDTISCDVSPQLDAQLLAAGQQRVRALVEDEERRVLPSRRRRGGELGRQCRFPGSGRANDQGAGPFFDATAEQHVEFGDFASQFGAGGELPVLGCDQSREHLEPAGTYHVVVIAATELHAAEFHNPQPPPLRPIIGLQVVQPNDAVRDALHLEIVVGRRHVVEEDQRAVAGREKLLERKNLPAVAERGTGQESQFRQGVEHYPGGLQPFHIRQNQLGGGRQLDF